MNVGIIGAGHIAGKIARTLEYTDGINCLAVGSRTLDKAKAFAAEFGIPKAYGSYGELFAQGGVSFMGLGINHCFDPNASEHKKAIQATTITFGSPEQTLGYGAGFDWYFKPIIIH